MKGRARPRRREAPQPGKQPGQSTRGRWNLQQSFWSRDPYDCGQNLVVESTAKHSYDHQHEVPQTPDICVSAGNISRHRNTGSRSAKASPTGQDTG